jgi:hypothetical protein
MFAKIDSGDDDLLNRIIWLVRLWATNLSQENDTAKKLREDDDD